MTLTNNDIIYYTDITDTLWKIKLKKSIGIRSGKYFTWNFEETKLNCFLYHRNKQGDEILITIRGEKQ